MSFRYQLSDLKADAGIRAASGKCSDSAAFLAQANQVIRQLLKRGGWFGTEVLARFCIHSCSITLPRHVGTLIGARFCTGQAMIHNNWYSIVGPSQCGFDAGSGVSLRDEGLFPTYNDITGTTGKQIAYHVVKQADVGKTITIYGTQYGGQPLQTKQSDGTWQMGVTITAAMAGGATLPQMTTQLVTKITSVVREATNGMTYLYEYGADSTGANVLRDLAVYEPTETNPQYRRLRVLNYCSVPKRQDDYDRNIATLEAMVKLEFIPLVNDWDFVLLSDFDAIRYGFQAIRKDEAGDFDGAEAFWTKAVRELQYTDREKTPLNQTSIKVRTGAGMLISPI